MTYKESTIRKSLLLTPKEWASLEKVAAELGSTAPTGGSAGKPSWRTLIKNIADDALIVTRKEPDHDQPSQPL